MFWIEQFPRILPLFGFDVSGNDCLSDGFGGLYGYLEG